LRLYFQLLGGCFCAFLFQRRHAALAVVLARVVTLLELVAERQPAFAQGASAAKVMPLGRVPEVRPALSRFGRCHFHICANSSGVQPTRSLTCPSPHSTTRGVKSAREAISTEKNGAVMRCATSVTNGR